MSQAKLEQLSTLVDDELDPVEMDAAIGALSDERELRAAWDRYHLIGDALRGEPLSRDVLSVAPRVRDRLDVESVASLPRPRRAARRRWLGPAVGSALAASLVLIAVIIGPEFTSDDGLKPLQLAQEVPTDSSPPTLYVDHTGTYWSLQRPEMETKLNSFLVNHQAYAPTSGIKSYATFVSYDVRR